MLVSLLLCFYELSDGCIVFDGENYFYYVFGLLCWQIVWVGQSVVLFDGIIVENIVYGELVGVSEVEIEVVVMVVNVMEFISCML